MLLAISGTAVIGLKRGLIPGTIALAMSGMLWLRSV
jgi:hypothetical protein